MSKQYDLVVLGGGMGGYVAAIRASQLGMNVAIVEANKLGGTCLHKGCIPTKTLLKTADVFRKIKEAHSFGIDVTVDQINFQQTQKRKNEIITTLEQGIDLLMKKNNITVYNGFGRILGPSIFSPLPGTISVEYESGKENTMLVPKFVLIATGSKPKTLPEVPFDQQTILTSDDILHLERLPSSIVIVGGGVIGIEWASILHDLGVEVTIVESAPHILTNVDDEIRTSFEKKLRKRGIQLYTNATIDVASITNNKTNVSLNMNYNETEHTLESEKLLFAIGREANILEIGLQNTEIEVDRGVIQVNDTYQTKESHIYAVGDCIGGLQLAHVASKEGIIAVEHMAGLHPTPLNNEQVPEAIYSYPQIAKIGLTENEAETKGYAVKIGKFPFQAIGKAHIEGDPFGFVKIISDEKTNDILGIHMIGPNVTELISEASLAKVLDATAWEIGNTIHPHPSLAEVFQEAALASDNIQIHS